jgi:hypothetical protein
VALFPAPADGPVVQHLTVSISALEGQGIVQQLDLLVRAMSPRVGWNCCGAPCEGPPLSVNPRAQHLAKVRVFAEFAADHAQLRSANAPAEVFALELAPRDQALATPALPAAPQPRN